MLEWQETVVVKSEAKITVFNETAKWRQWRDGMTMQGYIKEVAAYTVP